MLERGGEEERRKKKIWEPRTLNKGLQGNRKRCQVGRCSERKTG